MDELRVGHGRIDITPPLGCRMMGYGSRKEGAKEVHDPLTASAVWLTDGWQRVVLVAYDLASFDEEVVDELRAAVRAATGLADHEMVFNTSHTHAGPLVARREGMPLNWEYVQTLADRTAQVACAARDDARPARLRVGLAPVDIGVNRRERQPDGTFRLGVNPDGPILRELALWVFDREDADAVGVFSIPMHGTTMGASNLALSAEWMGFARTFAEQALPGTKLVFLQGCGADQNPYRHPSDFAQVEEHGRTAAAALVQAWQSTRPVAGVPLRVASRVCAGPLEDGDAWPIPVVGVRVGDAVLVGMGGEAVVEYAFHARAHSPAASTIALGYTNGSVGYLPTVQILEEGGYEATANRYFKVGRCWRPEIEEILKDEISTTLAELMESQP
jgi:hypothetical protein